VNRPVQSVAISSRTIGKCYAASTQGGERSPHVLEATPRRRWPRMAGVVHRPHAPSSRAGSVKVESEYGRCSDVWWQNSLGLPRPSQHEDFHFDQVARGTRYGRPDERGSAGVVVEHRGIRR